MAQFTSESNIQTTLEDCIGDLEIDNLGKLPTASQHTQTNKDIQRDHTNGTENYTSTSRPHRSGSRIRAGFPNGNTKIKSNEGRDFTGFIKAEN